jgi:acetoacetyl-CoA synthetase
VGRHISHAELHRAVAQTAAALRAMGVKPRATASPPICPTCRLPSWRCWPRPPSAPSSPRPRPISACRACSTASARSSPRCSFACDGYFYNGKAIDCLGKVAEIAARMPSLERVVIVPYAGGSAVDVTRGMPLADFLAPHAGETEIRFERLPFDHPLYILYSSGTTGVPKCIVHGAGGTLLQHLKEHRLHGDIRPGDRLFYFTTCGWMMWNWLASGLASGATLLLYDGSPFVGRGSILFDYAEAEGMTHFGTSAKFIDAIAKINLAPAKTHNLESCAPSSPPAARWCRRPSATCTRRSSATCSSPRSPAAPTSFPASCWATRSARCGAARSSAGGWAWRSRCSTRRAIRCARPRASWSASNPFPRCRSASGTTPMAPNTAPPISSASDNIWCHGDFMEETAHGGYIIYGRSDATLNPGGVRIGTAEIYRQVEKLDEVLESLVIGQDWDNDVRVVLFVKLREGLALDDALARRIKEVIRQNTTPRHVPAKILQVADIPRTKSNKIVELAVRNIVHGEPVKNVEALANPKRWKKNFVSRGRIWLATSTR